MKKKIFYSILLLLASTIGVWADDRYVITDVTIPQGGTVELPIGFAFDSGKAYAGFQLNIGLPEGITTVRDEDNIPIYSTDASSLGEKFSITATQSNGFAALPKSTSATIKGTSGTLITITLAAEASLEVGTVLTANVTDAMFSDGLQSVDIPDFTFIITIGEPDDGRIKFSETATKLPTYTVGEKGNVRMTRNIKAGQWSTIILPFTLTKAKAEAAFGSDVQLAEFSGFEVDYGDDEENVTPLGITVNFTTYTMSAKKSMTGGKPFLIKTSKDIESFEADDVTLFASVSEVTKSDDFDTTGKFTGSLTKTVVPADGLFISDNKFWYSTGKTNIKAFRGWLELGAVLDKETDFGVKMNILVDGDETRVDDLNVNVDEAVFDLSGRKVTKPQQRGVYIVNGKKTLVK